MLLFCRVRVIMILSSGEGSALRPLNFKSFGFILASVVASGFGSHHFRTMTSGARHEVLTQGGNVCFVIRVAVRPQISSMPSLMEAES